MQGSTVMHQSRAGTLAPEEPEALIAHVRVCGGPGWVTTGSTRKSAAYSVRSVRRASGMEECGNTSGIQVLDEPLELSVVDHSTA
jgi:hypothetical protein